MARISPFVLIPPLAFAAVAGLFLGGMFFGNGRELPSTLIGQTAPAVPQEALAGQPMLTDADLRSGELTLVNFWASWCPPCLKEMPDLEGLARDMKGRAFSLVALSGDDSWAQVDPVFGGQPLEMKVFRDPQPNKQHLSYGTEKLPETYVIDKQGRLRLRFINVQPWRDEELRSYLEWLADE